MRALLLLGGRGRLVKEWAICRCLSVLRMGRMASRAGR